MKNLSVKYKSQWDGDANMTNNDCGPCSIAMILNYYGENVTTNTVFERTGAGGGLISWPQLQTAIKSLGYKSTLERGGSLSRVRQLIDNDIPVIILVHYGSLNSTQDKNFKGGHFFTVVGYNEDGFFVNDSNFKTPLRQDGDHHNYLSAEIDKAWKDCNLDGNQPYSLLFIERKAVDVPSVPKEQVTVDLGEPYGVQEAQAIKSMLRDKDRILKANIDTMNGLKSEVMILKDHVEVLNDINDHRGDLLNEVNGIVFGRGWTWVKINVLKKLLN